MSAQVGAVCRSAYNYLRQLRPVVRALSVTAADDQHNRRLLTCRADPVMSGEEDGGSEV